MSNLSVLAALDPEDLTPKQLRKILNGIARSQLPFSKKTKEEQDEDKDEAEDESESLADLKQEKNGDGKAPPVMEDDLPEGIAEAMKPKNKKDKA